MVVVGSSGALWGPLTYSLGPTLSALMVGLNFITKKWIFNNHESNCLEVKKMNSVDMKPKKVSCPSIHSLQSPNPAPLVIGKSLYSPITRVHPLASIIGC